MIRMVALWVNTASKEPAMITRPSASAMPTTVITGYQVTTTPCPHQFHILQQCQMFLTSVTMESRRTTAGSGLTCQYGLVPGNGSSHNLTTQICNKNETMCITVYNLHNHHGPVSDGFTWFSCHDPSTQDGAFNQTDACFDDAIFCTPPHHEGDQPDCQDNATVCTCNTDLCNTYNMTSSNSPASSTTTQIDTMRCWFGEKHPSTGNETWKVEVCEENENHCC